MPQPHSIEAVGPAPSNAVRSHEHPMLEVGNLSFPDGRYLLEFQRDGDDSSYKIRHRIEGAPLITRLLNAGQARFVCIVSSPISSYRETHVSKVEQQEVQWERDELGQPPMFTPMIVCWKAQKITLRAKRDGVHAIWNQQRVILQRGSRLALGRVIHLESSIEHLLSLHKDEQLKDGQFAVEIETEPFRFRANVSPDLHLFLRHPRDENHNNIMTHIVTACLARLQHEYENPDEWRSFPSLVALADYLESNRQEHWNDREFRPEKVATALYPHVLPKGASTDAEEDEGE